MADDRAEVVVIAGASAGIGRATALAFAAQGASVALLARDKARLDSVVKEVGRFGGRGLAMPADIADAAAVEQAASRCEEVLGPIDIWVNCAMVTVFSQAAEMLPEEYRRVTEVTYLGTVHGTLAALTRMRERGRGVIVQTGSALSYRAVPLQSAYCAAKFAIRGFTDSLRTELLHEKSHIHITMVQLAAFNTPQFQWARSRLGKPPQPLPPIFQPELAARALVHAARHQRREWSVGFPALQSILGARLFPGLTDRLAARMAWDGQIDSEAKPLVHSSGDNLFHTIPGDYRCHGRFDHRSRRASLQWWINSRPLIPLALCVVALGLAILLI